MDTRTDFIYYERMDSIGNHKPSTIVAIIRVIFNIVEISAAFRNKIFDFLFGPRYQPLLSDSEL